MKFNLLIERRAVPALGDTQVTGFLINISSPSTNVEPNPYPVLPISLGRNQGRRSVDAVC